MTHGNRSLKEFIARATAYSDYRAPTVAEETQLLLESRARMNAAELERYWRALARKGCKLCALSAIPLTVS